MRGHSGRLLESYCTGPALLRTLRDCWTGKTRLIVNSPVPAGECSKASFSQLLAPSHFTQILSSKEIVQAAAPDLVGKLCERIDREGQITFHDWMQTALYDEHHGYYRRQDR